MGSRLAERVVTGPLAFFVAGVLDVLAFWVTLGRERVAARLARRRRARA